MLRSRSSADVVHFHAYGGYSRSQRERAITKTLKLAGSTQGHVGSAASKFEGFGYGRFSLWTRITYLTCALRIGCRSPVGARDEVTSSKDQVMTYPYYVGILKPSPPTIYHGQGLAWGSHTGSYSYRTAMSKIIQESVCT